MLTKKENVLFQATESVHKKLKYFFQLEYNRAFVGINVGLNS